MNIHRFCLLLTMFGIVWVQMASAALTNHYVVKNNAGSAVPYDTVVNAASNIQIAIDYAKASETVLVYAATYDAGETLVFSCSNRVYISKVLTVRSVNNDPTNTIIRGAWDPVSTNGPAAVRCVYMVDGASLVGFTLTNGATVAIADLRSNCGGGIYAGGSSAIISNCIIAGNAAYGDGPNGVGGGGVCDGTFYNCSFIGNRVGPGRVLGGGAFAATLYNCLLAGNTAQEGGGAFRSRLYGCVVSNNTATNITGSWSTGGGISGWSAGSQCMAYDCTIVGNRADRGGGAGQFTSLSNCTVTLNSAPVSAGQNGYGGGGYGAGMTACTVISNTSANFGAGGYGGYYTNCVFAYNSVGLHGPIRAYNCLIYACGYGAFLVSGNILDGCTIVGNNTGVYDYWSGPAGIIHVRNSVVYSNEVNWTRTDGAFVFTNTCTIPSYAGWSAGNITNDPRLVSYGSGFGTNHVAGNYRLRANSPCLNRGLNQAWMTNAVDLDGRIRIRYGTVDMGVYEAIYDGTIYKFR